MPSKADHPPKVPAKAVHSEPQPPKVPAKASHSEPQPPKVPSKSSWPDLTPPKVPAKNGRSFTSSEPQPPKVARSTKPILRQKTKTRAASMPVLLDRRASSASDVSAASAPATPAREHGWEHVCLLQSIRDIFGYKRFVFGVVGCHDRKCVMLDRHALLSKCSNNRFEHTRTLTMHLTLSGVTSSHLNLTSRSASRSGSEKRSSEKRR